MVQLIATADRVTARLDNLNRQIQTFINESKGDFASLGLSLDKVLKVTWDRAQLTDRRQALNTHFSGPRRPVNLCGSAPI
jgi:hypothetical protein